ncbi:MAG: YbaB/EbfC family nucleoid-associated protein [Candidatus Omnitrophica bacterium]|nr:YbaB/EbfC family nucleoid-associated protein [Candidatus Omnitrophota bacterium]
MFGKMKELMEMKNQADKIKRELEATDVECEEVRGIKITMNGAQAIKAIDIDPMMLGEKNKEKLQKDLMRSFNGAVKKSQTVAATKMRALMPGLPGF